MKKESLLLRKKAKILIIILLLQVVGVMKLFAQSHVNVQIDELNYVLNNNTFTAILVGHKYGNNATGELVIPSSVTYTINGVTQVYSVTSISWSAFSGCSGLSGNLIIPNSVTKIEDDAFNGCSGFTGELIIPNSITMIGERAFSFCSGFTGALTIPNSVIRIGMEAFFGCNGIMGSITLPSSVIEIGDGAFSCGGLDAVYYTGGIEQWCSIRFDGESANPLYFAHNLYVNNELVTNLVIPETVMEIKDYAFRLATCLTSLTISNSVTKIGNGAFTWCSGLSGNLIIPNSVSEIGDWAFYDCNGFTGNLILPNSVTTIGESAFADCSGLTSISIPNSVVFVGGCAFNGTGWYNNQPSGIVYLDGCCLGYKGSKPTGSLNIIDGTRIIAGGAFSFCNGLSGKWVVPNSVISICDGAFQDCSGFTGSLIIPNSVTSIGSHAFAFCSGFTGSLTIGNSVTSIGVGAFSHCDGFNSLTISNSVTSIEYYAFGECIGLNSIFVLAYTPPALDYYDGPFYEVDKTIPVYVPYGTTNAYRFYYGYNGWSDFTNYQEIAYKSIPGYGESNGNWQFVASPLAENTAPTEIEDMLPTIGTYDLYRFDQTENAEWQNYKANNFNLMNGQGYLYANENDVNIIFKGDFNENDNKEIALTYESNVDFAGWNLVGNPFPVNAYANRSYYMMNEDGTAIEPIAVSSSTPIAPCTGIMVKADNTGETVTFSKAVQQSQNNGTLQIAVAKTNNKANTIQDRVVVSFNEGDQLGKFVFNKDNARLYFPQGKDLYAIAFAEATSEMPLNFEAHESGCFTLTVNTEMVDMAYLHLIDNMTGANVDLLQTPVYSFEAKPTDYASRFRLVFSANDAENDPTINIETFAYYNGSEYSISNYGEATLQVIDIQGHIVSSTIINGNTKLSTNKFATGVYVLQLINGEKVRTQKIVVNN
jgi:hypothetical protein